MNKIEKSGLRPWLKIVLALSLALNLAVIGLGAGAVLRHFDESHRAGHRGSKPPMLGRFIFKDLGREEMHRLLQDHEGDSVSLEDRRRAEMDQIVALLQADELDHGAVEAVLNSHVVETQRFLRLVIGVWGQRLESLSPEDREALAQRMQHELERRPPSPKLVGQDN